MSDPNANDSALAPASAPTHSMWITNATRGELIATGRSSKVYIGLSPPTKELLAVKTMTWTSNDESAQSETPIPTIIDVLKDIVHPNVVQCLGYACPAIGHLHLFMEYVPGGSIWTCIHSHGQLLNEDITKFFMSQILHGLDYLHSKGLIHRNLKSDNILVTPTGLCKISGSTTPPLPGLGVSVDIDTHLDVPYMAPEVINPKQSYNSKKDIWSVGCVLIEMWSGKRVWDGEEMLPIMMKLYQRMSPPIQTETALSDLAEDFRAQCFFIDPDARPEAKALLQHPYLVCSSGWKFDASQLGPAREGDFLSTAPSLLRPTADVVYQNLQEFFPGVSLPSF